MTDGGEVSIIFSLFRHHSVPCVPVCPSLSLFSLLFRCPGLTWSDVTKLITQINFPSVAIQKFSLRSIKTSG